MPSEKVLQKKQAAVAALSEQMKQSAAGILVDYKGINVEDDTKLRQELREAGVEYTVIKNSILRRASKEAGYEEINELLVGSSALAMSLEDPVAPAKILAKYQKALKDHFTIKGGFVDGQVVSLDEIQRLSDLPSKEELIANLLSSLNAPVSKLAVVLNGNMQKLAIALSEISKQKSA